MLFRTCIVESQVSFHSQPLLRPLVLSSGAITELTEARVQVTVRVGEREASGHGSIYLSDLWAWPDNSLSHQHRDRVLREVCRTIAEKLPALCGEPAHPLELGLRLHERVCQPGENQPPALAQAMCLSPFDAAIHDAAGIAMDCSAFDFYRQDSCIPSADSHFPACGAVAAIREVLRPVPLQELPAWYVVGKDDDLERDVKPWALQRGYRCFKLKVLGKDNERDVARTAQLYRALQAWGVHDVRLSIDSNEANPDADSVLDYLCRLQREGSGAFDALQYLEQPTGRNIRRHPNDWRPVTKLKPVLLDEGLTSLALLSDALEQGWSGLALKTCKGHSFALVAAAWARQHGMCLALQDLTNPGFSAIHAALFAAFVPTINGVELNSPQFTPAANAPWLAPQRRLSGLFDPHDGVHRLPSAVPLGLGSRL